MFFGIKLHKIQNRRRTKKSSRFVIGKIILRKTFKRKKQREKKWGIWKRKKRKVFWKILHRRLFYPTCSLCLVDFSPASIFFLVLFILLDVIVFYIYFFQQDIVTLFCYKRKVLFFLAIENAGIPHSHFSSFLILFFPTLLLRFFTKLFSKSPQKYSFFTDFKLCSNFLGKNCDYEKCWSSKEILNCNTRLFR